MYSMLHQQLGVPSRKDLMQGPDEIGELLEKGNPFGEFFEHLSNAIFTGQAKDEDDEEPVTECFTAASSQEIQPEIYSELALKAFIKAIVKSMGSKISPKWKIAVFVFLFPVLISRLDY